MRDGGESDKGNQDLQPVFVENSLKLGGDQEPEKRAHGQEPHLPNFRQPESFQPQFVAVYRARTRCQRLATRLASKSRRVVIKY